MPIMTLTTFKEKRSSIRIPFTCSGYYSDGEFHSSGVTRNVTISGACIQGNDPVEVGMELRLLLVPMLQPGLMVTKATVRWVSASSFGIQIHHGDCQMIPELDG